MIEGIGVVVPARDEARRLTACFDALGVAAAWVSVPVYVVVVLDRCTDGSAEIVATATRRHAGVLSLSAVESAAGIVGAARARGAQCLIDELGVGGTWLATTDADSRVPPQWLRRQLEMASAGARVIAGTVEVTDWLTWPDPTRQAYEAAYARWRRADGHGHIHGANLGIHATLYRDLGGFRAVAFDEDVGLVTAAERAGTRVVWAADITVTTSARAASRTSHGFSTHLADHAPTPPRRGSALAPGAAVLRRWGRVTSPDTAVRCRDVVPVRIVVVGAPGSLVGSV